MSFLFKLVLLISISTASIYAQQLGPAQSDMATVAPAEAHPQSAVSYESVAKLKLASRKETYRIGELLIVDAALLNRSKERVFFLSQFSLNLSGSNQTGKQIHISPYGIIERALDVSSYTLTEPEDFIVKSSILLVSCDERAFEQNANNKGSLDLFNENLFVSWGSACLQINRPGTYYLSAAIRNNLVVLSPDEVNVKTAVGEIKSNKLKITVVR